MLDLDQSPDPSEEAIRQWGEECLGFAQVLASSERVRNLCGLTTLSLNDCICGEINARNCPVHGS